ncbi:hypothetical protein [Streptomyces sp. NPDC048606]|uniref:hypothetical protein n=1 Tax=Streptomyces sp. NPDC048606 TaxID=3154726 RepID=UPI003440179F
MKYGNSVATRMLLGTARSNWARIHRGIDEVVTGLAQDLETTTGDGRVAPAVRDSIRRRAFISVEATRANAHPSLPHVAVGVLVICALLASTVLALLVKSRRCPRRRPR